MENQHSFEDTNVCIFLKINLNIFILYIHNKSYDGKMNATIMFLLSKIIDAG